MSLSSGSHRGIFYSGGPTRGVVTRVLVVSHPAVLAVNQLPYAALRAHGWDTWLVVPRRWSHDYLPDSFGPERLPELEGRISTRRVLLPGSVQRHAYVTNAARIIDAARPAVAFVEAEPTAVPTLQWGSALRRRGIPFGVQVDENLPRPYPAPARLIRRWTIARAAFAAARSPTAARLLTELAPDLPTPLVPHHVPGWERRPAGGLGRPFTVGYAGRFVEEKGLDDLLQAVASISGARARFVGDGPLLGRLLERVQSGVALDIVTGVGHDAMSEAYASFDVLVLPSRTTATWTEQFGRVLVEALSCGVPVVGSSSGEIPWVVESTGGGIVFPEGDVQALRAALVALRDDPQRRARLASAGCAAVEERFSVPAVAGALDAALRAALATHRTGSGDRPTAEGRLIASEW